MTQAARLLAYIKAHPGASSLEVTAALRIVNVTGRISDLRAAGISIECRKVAGVSRYFVNARPAPLRGEQEAMAL